MRPGFLNTCLMSVYLLIVTAASPRDLPDVKGASTEPSCDELRAMWRFSKRQSRAAENTNEIPTYRDPFAYNMWEEHASIRSVGGGKLRRPLIYGRLVHNFQRPRLAGPDNTPERIRAFEEVARLFGTSVHVPKVHGRRKSTAIRLVGGNNGLNTGAAQTGSFQHLKELIQSERARELHEQKVSEETALRMMNQEQNAYHRGDYKQSSRSRGQLVNFPNLYYVQRSYPGSLVRKSQFKILGCRTAFLFVYIFIISICNPL